MSNSLDAERSVLGCALYDDLEVLEYTFGVLNENDFALKTHANIFRDMKTLMQSNKSIDIITVSGCGHDLEYLSDMMTLVPSVSAYKHYVGLVKDFSVRRQFKNAGERIVELSSKNYDSLTELKNDALQVLDINICDRKADVNIKNLLMETLSDIEQRYHGSENKKLYGLQWLDSKTGGAHDSDVTILAARPSVGKTAFAIQIAKNMAGRGNHSVIFSLEMGAKQLSERLLSNTSGVEHQKIRIPRLLADDEWEKLTNASGWLSEQRVTVVDNAFSVEEIRSVCRELKNKGMLDFVIVDYLQLIDTSKRCGTTNDRVSHISRQIKLMAKEFNVPFWLLSQLNRSNESNDRRPKLIDLRDSGAIEQDADNVILLHDPNYGKYNSNDSIKQNIELIIAKQRNGSRDIMTEIYFYKNVQRFWDK